jgi:site-specific DNA recombinase
MYGLDAQVRNCRAYAAAHGFEIIDELQDDVSGAIPISERPAGNVIYQYVDSGAVEAVLLPTNDRTARDEEVLEYLLFKNYLHENNVELHYADAGIDRYTMEDNLVGYIKANMASAERAKIVKRTVGGRVEKAMRNTPVGNGTPAYGYSIEHFAIENKINSRLIIDPETAQVVRQIFQWYTRGDGSGVPLSLRGIAYALLEIGAPPPKYKDDGEGSWNPTTIRNILKNEIYTGVTYYQKTRVVKLKNNKKKRVKNPPDQWIKIDVPHLAIIDKETFDWAQNRVERNIQLQKRNRQHEYLLAGFFHCSACGKAMSGTSGTTKNYKRYFYRCGCHWHKPAYQPCPNEYSTVSVNIAESLVWEWVRNILTDPEALDRGIRRMAERRQNEAEPKKQRLYTVEVELEKAERKVKRLISALEDEEDEYLLPELKNSLRMASKQREALAREKESLLDDIRDVEISPEKIAMIRERADEIKLKMIDPTYTQKRVVFDSVRLNCSYRIDDTGRWIDAECDLLPEGVSIELNPLGRASWQQVQLLDVDVGGLARGAVEDLEADLGHLLRSLVEMDLHSRVDSRVVQLGAVDHRLCIHIGIQHGSQGQVGHAEIGFHAREAARRGEDHLQYEGIGLQAAHQREMVAVEHQARLAHVDLRVVQLHLLASQVNRIRNELLAGFFLSGEDLVGIVAVAQAHEVEAGRAVRIVEHLVHDNIAEFRAGYRLIIFGGGHDENIILLQRQALEEVAFDAAHGHLLALLGRGEKVQEAVGGIRPVG